MENVAFTTTAPVEIASLYPKVQVLTGTVRSIATRPRGQAPTTGSPFRLRPMPTVLYIAGSPRSGTTLLARLLGELPRSTTVGELRLIWDRSFKQDFACGCGAPFSVCPFWSDVVRAWSETNDLSPDEGLRIRGELHTRSMGSVVSRALGAGDNDDLRRYVRSMDALYESIAAAASVDTIVDSSKTPADALALAALSRFDIRVIHLVRDPRGIVQSWTKRKKDPSLPGGSTVENGLAVTTARWLHLNAAMLRHRKQLGNPLLVRYEDIAADPAAEVRRISNELGFGPVELDVQQSSVNLSATHTVAGNPMRFDTGATRIAADEEWRTAMPLWKSGAVKAVTEPLLRLLSR